MASNADLNKANRAKKDEFYTQLTDIEKEMRHYEKHFENKTIFCNCDDPEYSHFWLYFQLNFFRLGLKKLVSTHYEADKPSYKMEIVRSEIEENRCKKGQSVGQLGYIPDYVKTPLEGNGDFRSPECIEILKEADIVITNPPFSLFRDYIAQLMEYQKDFIILYKCHLSIFSPTNCNFLQSSSFVIFFSRIAFSISSPATFDFPSYFLIFHNLLNILYIDFITNCML